MKLLAPNGNLGSGYVLSSLQRAIEEKACIDRL